MYYIYIECGLVRFLVSYVPLAPRRCGTFLPPRKVRGDRACSARRPSIRSRRDGCALSLAARRAFTAPAPCTDAVETLPRPTRRRCARGRACNGQRPRNTTITRRRARRASPAGRVDRSFNSLRFEGGFGRNRWSLALLLPGLATGHGSITTPKIVAYDGDAAPKAAFINEC